MNECCTNTVILGCDVDICAPFSTGLIAATNGTYSTKVTTPTGVYFQSFALLAGDAIPLPNFILNPQATNTVLFYDADGNLINNTCYIVKTKIHYTNCPAPITPATCAATFAPEVITGNTGVCEGSIGGMYLEGLFTLNLHSNGLSPAATIQLHLHGEVGTYTPIDMPFNGNLSDSSFWNIFTTAPYTDTLIDNTYIDHQCFWFAFVVVDGDCSYTLLFFINNNNICSNPTPMYYGIFPNGTPLDNTALSPLPIDTTPLCTPC